ncbi:Lysophospholipase L1 [Halopseudomonas salegens]|uniref:Lysophospholipase L1 n=1 Tax=Halopseudomonas salegens TaxID=1434072 RepID=A0A1H2EBY7_9GAMM|nr:Lysophospholipase L1 [Halopseudomonas salegens]
MPQALWVKRTALRLPDAAPPWRGLVASPGSVAGITEPLRLLILGESTVAGVGVADQTMALSGQLAQHWSAQRQRPVEWVACGRNGARARDCLRDLLPEVAGQYWDMVVIVLGVNDTTHLTGRSRWRREIRALLASFSACSQQLVLTAVPPLAHFHALPQPLRGWFGLRSGLLDQDLRAEAETAGAAHIAFDLPMQSRYLAEDGYHPSAQGYQLWARGIVRQLPMTVK